MRSRLCLVWGWAILLLLPLLAAVVPCQARAADCYQVTIQRPSPFMGNNGEVFQLSDGSVWEVKYEYEYMYEYYPSAVICPAAGKLIVKDESLNVEFVSGAPPAPSKIPTPSPRQNAPAERIITVVLAKSGCDYFIADGPQGFYLLEWFGGHSPSEGDTMVGSLSSYGFKDVFYTRASSNGRVWVDDYLLSRDRVIEKYGEKCH
jgi:hypothetical protein